MVHLQPATWNNKSRTSPKCKLLSLLSKEILWALICRVRMFIIVLLFMLFPLRDRAIDQLESIAASEVSFCGKWKKAHLNYQVEKYAQAHPLYRATKSAIQETRSRLSKTLAIPPQTHAPA